MVSVMVPALATWVLEKRAECLGTTVLGNRGTVNDGEYKDWLPKLAA